MKLHFVSEVACPLFEKGKLQRYLESLRVYTGGVIIVLGVVTGLFSCFYVQVLVFFISVFSIFMILTGLTYNLFMDIVPSTWVIYVNETFICIFSLVASFFLSRLKTLCCKPKPKQTESEKSPN
jgi:hypothetical protein